MSNFQRAPVVGGGGTNKQNVLSAIRATQIIGSKPVLPAEILSTILDYLPVPDLIAFARTSRRMREMVYEDSRWVQRLNAMGVWNEGEARKRFEETMKRKRDLMRARAEEHRKPGTGANGNSERSTTLFDAGIEEERQRRSMETAFNSMARSSLDGFEVQSPSSALHQGPTSIPRKHLQDPEALLNVFSEVKSIRGHARDEYGKIYGALAPFYFDLARSRSHVDPIIFRVYREPEQQAKMLSQLQIFSLSDWAQGGIHREQKLISIISVFENAVLREFEHGYESGDFDGRMRRYAHVLGTLNGGQAAVELFVQKNPLLADRELLGFSLDCINQASSDGILLEPSREFLAKLSKSTNEQVDIIDRVFPSGLDVLHTLLEKISEDILMEYVTPLFDEAHERSIPSYLKAVSGIFDQCMQFSLTLKPSKNSGDDFPEQIKSRSPRYSNLMLTCTCKRS